MGIGGQQNGTDPGRRAKRIRDRGERMRKKVERRSEKEKKLTW